MQTNKNNKAECVLLMVDGRPLNADSATDLNYPTVFAKSKTTIKNLKPEIYYQYGHCEPIKFVPVKKNFWTANCFRSMTHAQCTIRKTAKGLIVLFTIKTGARFMGGHYAA